MKNFLPILTIIFICLFTGRYLFSLGYFTVHDDIQVLRLAQMHRCFLDGQIPCRWTSEFGAGFGLPMFNYYAPLATLVGLPFVYLGLSYLTSVKLAILLSYFVGGLGMYY